MKIRRFEKLLTTYSVEDIDQVFGYIMRASRLSPAVDPPLSRPWLPDLLPSSVACYLEFARLADLATESADLVDFAESQPSSAHLVAAAIWELAGKNLP